MADTSAITVAQRPAGLANIPGLRQLGILVGIATSVAIGVVVVLWSQEPSYRALKTVPAAERVDVIAALESLNIKYRMDGSTGMLMVPSDSYQQVMANLQSVNLAGGSLLDFDTMYGNEGLGTSQFEETAKHQIATQNRIAKTLMTIRVIQNAQVMLALPERSAFLRDRKKPQASITVVVRPGAVLEAHQVQGIVHTVAASVPGLETKSVTVMNQHGELLTSPHMNNEMAQTATQYDYQQKLQDRLGERVENILMPMMGAPGRVRAVVAAELDFTQSEQTLETFDPSPDKIRGEKVERTVNSPESNAIGVPGALSNQPATTPAQEEGQDQEAVKTVSTKDYSLRNYELDKETTYTKNATGVVTRLSVALLLDHKPKASDSGATELLPLTQEEIERVSELAKKAVGFNEARGDTFFVTNEAFPPPPTFEAPDAQPIWTQAWAINIGKQLLAAVVLLGLGFGLLRPLLKNLTEVPQWQAVPSATGMTGISAPDSLGPNAVIDDVDPVTLAKNLAHQDPKRVAQVVKDWVTDE